MEGWRDGGREGGRDGEFSIILLPSQDCNGNTALHLAVQARRARAVSILINAGADVLTTNIDEFSTLSEAAKCGFFVYVIMFVYALHGGSSHSVYSHHSDKGLTIIVISPLWFLYFILSPLFLHLSYALRGIELFTNYYPSERHINHFRFADNHTLLHIAATNDHLDILCYLASRVSHPHCDFTLASACLVNYVHVHV